MNRSKRGRHNHAANSSTLRMTLALCSTPRVHTSANPAEAPASLRRRRCSDAGQRTRDVGICNRNGSEITWTR
eukprot:4687575-Prymnesium_polylepis.1